MTGDPDDAVKRRPAAREPVRSSDPLLDLVAAQTARTIDEGLERRAHRRCAVWGDLAR